MDEESTSARVRSRARGFVVAVAGLTLSRSLAYAQIITAPIGVAKEDNDFDYFADHIDDLYRVTGVVTSPDFRRSVGFGLSGGAEGSQIFFQDAVGDGLLLFFPDALDPGYDVSQLAIGKEIEVTGRIKQYNGSRYIEPGIPSINISVLGDGPATLPATVTIAQLLAPVPASGNQPRAEIDYEGSLVRIDNVTITGGGWPGRGSSATLTIGDGTGAINLRIDRDTSIDGQPEPAGSFDLVGILNQFDAGLPPDGGYQVQPRFYSDFVQTLPAEVPGLTLHPDGQPGGTITARAGEELVIDLVGTDPNTGDTLSFSMSGEPAGSVLTNTLPREAQFTWTPSAGARGTTATVSFTVSDGNGSTADDTQAVDIFVLPATLEAILLHEVHYDPDSSSAGDANRDGTRNAFQDEFVEIFNSDTGNTESLAGWTIEFVNSSGTRSTLYTFPGGAELRPEAAVVVFGGGSPTGDFSGADVYASAPDWSGLANGGDRVLLVTDNGIEVIDFDYSGFGSPNQSVSLNSADDPGSYTLHANHAPGVLFSPGRRPDGTRFAKPPGPEIGVEQPAGSDLIGGVSMVDFGPAPEGDVTSRDFRLTNTGTADLTGVTAGLTGAHAAEFLVTVPPASSVSPGNNTSFTVAFAPAVMGTGSRGATLNIGSNDSNENPFSIALTGDALSSQSDGDNDGLNDAAEWKMAALGFNWQVSQPDLVGALFDNADAAGLYTEDQVHALNIDVPLLGEDPVSGDFLLTIGVQKSTDLQDYFPFPMSAPQTSINAEGKLEFRFADPGAPAFFRLESR